MPAPDSGAPPVALGAPPEASPAVALLPPFGTSGAPPELSPPSQPLLPPVDVLESSSQATTAHGTVIDSRQTKGENREVGRIVTGDYRVSGDTGQ
jgi:hypothetical protein